MIENTQLFLLLLGSGLPTTWHGLVGQQLDCGDSQMAEQTLWPVYPSSSLGGVRDCCGGTTALCFGGVTLAGVGWPVGASCRVANRRSGEEGAGTGILVSSPHQNLCWCYYYLPRPVWLKMWLKFPTAAQTWLSYYGSKISFHLSYKLGKWSEDDITALNPLKSALVEDVPAPSREGLARWPLGVPCNPN